jgi:hypothetical protein
MIGVGSELYCFQFCTVKSCIAYQADIYVFSGGGIRYLQHVWYLIFEVEIAANLMSSLSHLHCLVIA